jgi:hypothetical protein
MKWTGVRVSWFWINFQSYWNFQWNGQEWGFHDPWHWQWKWE